jgi:hypothetical protein
VANPDLLGDPDGVVEFGRRQRLGFGGTGDGVLTQRIVGQRRDHAGVDAAGEGDDHSIACCEVLADGGGLLGDG